jgi:hypothetical protein
MRNTSQDGSDKGAERFSARELETIIPVSEAAKLRGISRDTFIRHYPDLIRKLSTRRNGVKLRDALLSD